MSSWIEISACALAHNVTFYKQVLGSALLACVIKSNAYGHGMLTIASLLDTNKSVDYLCTFSLSEALMLRDMGIQKPIVVLSSLDENLERIVNKRIAVVVYDLRFAEQLNEIGKKYNTRIPIHAKIDTGLSRVGVLYVYARSFIETLSTMSHLALEGVFTHFANVENEDQTFSRLQRRRFDDLIQELKKSSIAIPYQHISSSAAITSTLDNHYTFARAGIGIYGLWPSHENKKTTQQQFPDFHLKPVMTWKSRLIQLKEVPAQSYVGYFLTYLTQRPTMVGLLPVGYWDGYDRGLSNKGFVYINGHKAPVIGRVAMNLIMVDCTDVPQVKVGDEALLLGSQEGITADDIAHSLETISYEVVTRINPLIQRIVVP